MGTTWAGGLSASFGVLLILVLAGGGDESGQTASGGSSAAASTPAASTQSPPKVEQEPQAAVDGARGPATPQGEAGAATGATTRPGDETPKTETAKGETGTGDSAAEAQAARAETNERLKRLAQPAEHDPPAAAAAGKALREVFEERLHWLDEWEKAAKARHDAEHPEPSPERQAAAMKADLERVRALLDQASKDHAALLPGVFLKPAGQVTDALRLEMKEALDAAKVDRNDWKAKLEKMRADTAKASNTLSPLRVERDKIHQRLAALKSRNEEREAAVAAAKSPEEGALARERLINFHWETRVESERLEVQEAFLASEATRAELAALGLQVLDAHVQLATRTLERMQERYRVVSDDQESRLKQAAASEQTRAARSGDPLEKYRARRTAELLDLQAQVLKFENLLATSPSPSPEEQRSLADRADADFAGVKTLIDDGRVSHLDALRLNNDFRRIGPERSRIVAHELAAAAWQLTFYENTLSSVEIDLINDSRDDRLQHEDLLERLPKPRRAEALSLCQEIEARHLALLERKRLALEKLAGRAEETYRQIERRLKILDDQYGFIRTHIFWVRDQEPLGAVTLAQCRREVAILGRSLLPMVREACDRSLWGRVTAEFAVATLALLGLPWPLYRLRRSLCPGRPQAP